MAELQYKITVKHVQIKRPTSPGATRVQFIAENVDGTPAHIFLCSVQPPNTYEQRYREAFETLCSVEDMFEYPVGVSHVSEIDPATQPENTFMYDAQENRVYIRTKNVNDIPVWKPYIATGTSLQPNVHTHKMPFFRRSVIDIIVPNRLFVDKCVKWISDAAKMLKKDLLLVEKFDPKNETVIEI
jgi:hypothetical protein